MLPKQSLILPAALAAVVFLNGVAVAAGPAPEPLSTPSGGAATRRVGCAEVISKLDNDTGGRRGRGARISVVARALGTTPWWVERCMTAYGRSIPMRRDERTGESLAEDRAERFEEDEPEEVAPEDAEEPGGEHEAPEKPIKTPRPTPNDTGFEGF